MNNPFFEFYAGRLIEDLARRAVEALPGAGCNLVSISPDVLRASITDPSLAGLGDRELEAVAATVAVQLRRFWWPS